MVKEIQLRVNLIEEKQDTILQRKAAQFLDISKEDISVVKVLRKSIDARKKIIVFNYKVRVYIQELPTESSSYSFQYKDVSSAKEIHIIGFWSCGYVGGSTLY